jgi:acetate kinase
LKIGVINTDEVDAVGHRVVHGEFSLIQQQLSEVRNQNKELLSCLTHNPAIKEIQTFL